jgi:hypothetical protein
MADAIGLSATADVASKAGRGVVGARVAEAVTLFAGFGLILFAMVADRDWVDRHILPHMFLQHGPQILWWMVERSLAFLVGFALILPVRRRVGRAFRAGRGGALILDLCLMAIAVPLALLMSEFVLRSADWARLERWVLSEEPLRQADRHLGWTNIPNRTGVDQFGGTITRYALDARGRRIADLAQPLDPARPSILFAGESMMFGFRLSWQDTAAAQVGMATGLQSVNISVNGYGTDQELMRLRQELPRFARPVAVVALFAPSLLERSLDSHRPHLDAALRWHPGQPAWRLERVFKNVLLYHSTARIDEAVAMTRASLTAITAEARARGAIPLILVPEFMPEQPAERRLRERVLTGLPYVQVRLDRRWSIPGDGHPNSYANRVMAQAIASALAAHVPPERKH